MTTVFFSAIDKASEQGDETFTDAEGSNYYYAIVDSDCEDTEFIISDSCGRYIPFPLEDLDVLIEALENYRVNLLDNMFNEPDSVAILD